MQRAGLGDFVSFLGICLFEVRTILLRDVFAARERMTSSFRFSLLIGRTPSNGIDESVSGGELAMFHGSCLMFGVLQQCNMLLSPWG